MKFIYPPIKNLSTSPNAKSITFDDLYTNPAFSNDLGSYIVGKNKVFHGGLNLTVPNGYAVQSVADGRIIAYRLSKTYQTIEIKRSKNGLDKGTQVKTLEFSNNFILIEHDLDQLEYTRYLDGSVADSPYKGYKFYSLYMHLMPLDHCEQQAILPDWLVLDKNTTNILPRGTELFPKVLKYEKGFTKANVKKNLRDIDLKISEKDVVTIQGLNYLNKPLIQYDASGSGIGILEKFKASEDVVVLDKSTAIKVHAGEVIGYAGKSQANSISSEQDDSIHFEIWLKEKEFLNNPEINEWASYVPDNGKYKAQRAAVITNLNQRCLGLVYLKAPNTVRVYESFSFDDDKTDLYAMWRDIGTYNFQNALDTAFLQNNLGNNPVAIKTDADWLTRPKQQWEVFKQSDFFMPDGRINAIEVKELVQNRSKWNDKHKKVFIELEYSEWDKQFFDAKFSFLLNVTDPPYNKIDQNTYDALKSYQDKVSFLDKTQASPLVPKTNEITVAHPIEFLKDMQRCLLPAPPSSNTHLVKRLIQYALDEDTYLLKKLLNRMEQWIAGKKDKDLDQHFFTWFGFKRGIKNVAKATNIKFLSDQPHVVEDFNTAQNIVLTYFEHAFKVLEKLKYQQFCFAWGMDTGAYVNPNDLNQNIHLGFHMYGHSAVNQSGIISRVENFSIPSFRRIKQPSIGFVNCMVHECLHFAIPNWSIKNSSIINSMLDLDGSHKFLTDVEVDYVVNGGSTEFRSYGLEECKDLAKYIPYACLANSDNYAEFFAEALELTRPVIKYRCI